MTKKLVEKEKLKNLVQMINQIQEQTKDEKTSIKLIDLVFYIEKELLETDREDLNEFKRSIYMKMKEPQGEENKRYYELYQQLKGVK
jgi:tRNA splicing endonuclease